LIGIGAKAPNSDRAKALSSLSKIIIKMSLSNNHSSDSECPTRSKRPKNEYQLFLQKRKIEITNTNPNIQPKDCLKQIRDEWKIIKEQKQKTKKKGKIGRPPSKNKKEKLDDPLRKGRGRPPKNPLKSYLNHFEEWKKLQYIDFNSLIDAKQYSLQWTEQIFNKLNENRIELEDLVNTKNRPKRKRGRPAGSKNKNKNEEDIVVSKEPDEITTKDNFVPLDNDFDFNLDDIETIESRVKSDRANTLSERSFFAEAKSERSENNKIIKKTLKKKKIKIHRKTP